jgi:hypothetical protein
LRRLVVDDGYDPVVWIKAGDPVNSDIYRPLGSQSDAITEGILVARRIHEKLKALALRPDPKYVSKHGVNREEAVWLISEFGHDPSLRARRIPAVLDLH